MHPTRVNITLGKYKKLKNDIFLYFTLGNIDSKKIGHSIEKKKRFYILVRIIFGPV